MTEREALDVSVVVVTYNREESLCTTLRCLVSQQPAPREILVVDQSQQHETTTERFLDQLIDSGQINYLQQAEPNAQRARNTAIREASGSVLLFVDDDISAGPDLVGKHWQNYVADTELAAVCGFYTEPGESPIDFFPSESQDPVAGWIYFPHCYTRRTSCHSLATCNGSIRREVAIRIGGFDENYTYTHLDDTDFSARLKQLGAKAIHDPEAHLVHLKEMRGGKRPGRVNEYVIADSNRWYTWCYFFWMNFRWQGRSEILRRLRRCVFRRVNVVRPWYLLLALGHFIAGATRAMKVIRGGRKLGFPLASNREPEAVATGWPGQIRNERAKL
ncbi:MAG TPA: glycosyltransferase [Pyrinomonadaceae bacterium]|nr:glycosyltransferase [Pyrinomonadaceae bacterium]